LRYFPRCGPALYQVFVPENWTPKQKWPIILFLHGAGEGGSDGLLQTVAGPPQAIRTDRSRFPTVVVMPQCLRESWWPAAQMEAVALAALDAATAEFKGDPKRTYLAGLSMGGYGSWDLASRCPGKFAAVVPICPGGGRHPKRWHHPSRPPCEVASGIGQDRVPRRSQELYRSRQKIGKTPVWIFHGANDQTVPPDCSRKMNKALKAAGGNVRYTEYAGVGDAPFFHQLRLLRRVVIRIRRMVRFHHRILL
jgi:predicted peptidase